MFGRYPEITHTRQLIRPADAADLGNMLLRDPEVAEGDDRFNVSLGISRVFPGQTPQIALMEMVGGKERFDDETRDLLAKVGASALHTMSGMKRGGLPRGLSPIYVSMDTNVFEPGEEFPTHADKGLRNDVVSVTLLGRGATFMHVDHNTPWFEMPDDENVLRRWQRMPGDAIHIRNHATAREDRHRFPLHAVQNDEDRRVTLQVQVSYDYR